MVKIENDLIESFILMNEFLQKNNIRYCLIGGMAAGFWGEPRYTKDMDFTVMSMEGSLDTITQKLTKEEFKVVSKGASQIQVVKKNHLHFIADLILAETEYQDWVIQRAINVKIFSQQVPICTAEDLIILKLIANRRQDLLDIENVLKIGGARLDFTYLKKWFLFWEITERFNEEFKNQFPAFIPKII